MKKFNFIVFLSALLCAMMLFTACGEEEPVNEDVKAPQIDAPADVIDELPSGAETDDIDSAITDINNYLAYDQDKQNEAPIKNAYQLFDEKNSESLYSADKYIAVIREERKTPNVAGDVINIRYKAVNLITGKTFCEFGPITYIEHVSLPTLSYSFDVVSDIILEVRETKIMDQLDPIVTYQYIGLDGKNIFNSAMPDKPGYVVPEKYHQRIEPRDVNGYTYVTIDIKTFVIYDDEIVYSFDAGAERELPRVQHEYGSYKYVVEEVEDEYFIQVLDENYICLSQFQIPAKILGDGRANTRTYVLGNGNILVCGAYAVSDKEEYDYIYNLRKYASYTALYDVATGTAQEIELDFIITDLYSAEDKNAPCSISADYNAATILTYDRVKETLTESAVILNNQLEIACDLPTILATQIDEVKDIVFVDMMKFTFTTEINNHEFKYLVDSVAGTASLISNDAQFMDRYFYTDKAIYDFSLNELYRMSADETVLATIGNALLIKGEGYYKIFSAKEVSGADVKEISESSELYFVSYGDDYVVFTNKQEIPDRRYYIYNSAGECVLVTESAPTITEITDGCYRVAFSYYNSIWRDDKIEYLAQSKSVVLNNK